MAKFTRKPVTDEELRKIAGEQGHSTALQYLLRNEYGLTSYTDASSPDHLSFSYRRDPDLGSQRGFASIEIHGFEGHSAIEVGGRLFNNTRMVGMGQGEYTYPVNEQRTSGLRYAAEVLYRTYAESNSAASFNLNWQQAAGGLPQGYLAHVGDLAPRDKEGNLLAHESSGNRQLAEGVLSIYQLRKPAKMAAADWMAAVNLESSRNQAVPGVHFGITETEHTYETLSNMMPLSILPEPAAQKWKSVKSAQFRLGLPMGNAGMPGTGAFAEANEEYTWGRMKVGQIAGSPGGGMIMAQEPYAVRQRELYERLLPGELGKLGFSFGDQSAFYGENIQIGQVEGGRRIAAPLGGASYASIKEGGVTVYLGHGREVVDSLKGIPGLERYANQIQRGFAYPTVEPSPFWDEKTQARRRMELADQQKARGEVMNVLQALPQYRDVQFEYHTAPNITIGTKVDAFVPGSVKGYGVKAGISMIDFELGAQGYMGLIEPSSIKNPHLIRQQEQHFYANLYGQLTGPATDKAGLDKQYLPQEQEIALSYGSAIAGGMKPDEAYRSVLPAIEQLGAIHRVTRSNEFLVPEERSNSGRLSAMDLMALYRTGGAGAKTLVEGMIHAGADPITGSITASLFNTGGARNFGALNLPVEMAHQDVVRTLADMGVDPDQAFSLGGQTLPSLNAIGTQGPVYASVRRALSAATENDLAQLSSEAMQVIDRTFTSGDAFAKRMTEINSYNLGGRLRYHDPNSPLFTGEGRSQNDVYVGRKEIERLARQLDVPIADIEELASQGDLMTLLGGYPNKNAMGVGRVRLANEASGFAAGMYEELEFSVSSTLNAIRFERDNDYDFGPQPVALTRTWDEDAGRWRAAPVQGSKEAFEEQTDLAQLAVQSLAAMAGPQKVYEHKVRLAAALGREPTWLEILSGALDPRDGQRIPGLSAGVQGPQGGNENVWEKNQTKAESGLTWHEVLWGAFDEKGRRESGSGIGVAEAPEVDRTKLAENAQSVNAARLQAPVYGMTKQLGLGLSAADRAEYNQRARAANPYWQMSGLDPYQTATQTYEGPYQLTVDFNTLPDHVQQAYAKLYYSNGFPDPNGHADKPENLASTLFSSFARLDYIDKEALAYSVGGVEHMEGVARALHDMKPGGVIPQFIRDLLPQSQFTVIAGINQAINFMQDELEGRFADLTPQQQGAFATVRQNHLKFIDTHPVEYEAIMAARRGSVPKNIFGRDINGEVIGRILDVHKNAAGSMDLPSRTPAVQVRKKVEGSSTVQPADTLLENIRRIEFMGASAMGALAGLGSHVESQTLSFLLNRFVGSDAKLEMDQALAEKGAKLEKAVEGFEDNPDLHPFGHMVMSVDDIREWEKAHPGEKMPETMGYFSNMFRMKTSWLPDALKYDGTGSDLTITDFKASRVEDARRNFAAYQVQQSLYAHRMAYMAQGGTTATAPDGTVTHTGERQELFKALTAQAGFTPQRANDLIADLAKNGVKMIKTQLYANHNTFDIRLNDPSHLEQHIIPMAVLSADEITAVARQAKGRLATEIQNPDLITDISKAAIKLSQGETEVDLGGTTYTARPSGSAEDAASAWGRVTVEAEQQMEKNRQRDAVGRTPQRSPGDAAKGATGAGGDSPRYRAVMGGAPAAGGSAAFDRDAMVDMLKEVTTWIYQTGMMPMRGQSHGGTLPWGQDQDAWNTAISTFFNDEGRFTGSVNDVKGLIAGGALGMDQIKFIENARRLAQGKVSPSEANDMVTNALNIAQMGQANWAVDGVAGSPSSIAHERVFNAYARMADQGAKSTAEYRATQSTALHSAINQDRANIADMYTRLSDPGIAAREQVRVNDAFRMEIGNAMARGQAIDGFDAAHIPDPVTRAHEETAIASHNRAIKYQAQGRAMDASVESAAAEGAHDKATQASVEYAKSHPDNYNPADLPQVDRTRVEQADVLNKAMSGLVENFDKLNKGLDPTITTVKGFKNVIDETQKAIKAAETAKGIAEGAGLFKDAPDEAPGTGAKRRETFDLALSAARSHLADGGAILEAADERLSDEEYTEVSKYADTTRRGKKPSSKRNAAGQLLGGMFAFQVARDLRYSFTPLEQAATQFDAEQQQAMSMAAQNGAGFNMRRYGQGQAAVVQSNLAYGFGETTSHTMAGLAAILGGNGAAVGSGPLGAAASVALPGLGAGAIVASLANILAPEVVAPLAIGAGLTASAVAANASYTGARNNPVTLARARTTMRNQGFQAALSEDAWSTLAQDDTLYNVNKVASLPGIFDAITRNAPQLTVAGQIDRLNKGRGLGFDLWTPSVETLDPRYQQASDKVAEYFKVGSATPGNYANMSEAERRAFMAGAAPAGGNTWYTQVGDAASIDRPTQQKMLGWTLMRSGQHDIDRDLYQTAVSALSNGEDPMQRMQVSDTIAELNGDMTAYGGNDIFKSSRPMMQLNQKARRLQALGGAAQAWERVKAGFTLQTGQPGAYPFMMGEINDLSDQPLTYEQIKAYSEAVGNYSQVNGGDWGAAAAERAGRGPAESIAAPLREFAGSAPSGLQIAQRSMQESRLTEYAQLSRRYEQYGDALGTRTGKESDVRFEFDTSTAGIRADIVNAGVANGMSREKALALAQSVTPDPLTRNIFGQLTANPSPKAYSPQELAGQMGAKWLAQMTPLQQARGAAYGVTPGVAMGSTIQGQQAYDYLTSFTPQSATVALSQGAGAGAGMGLMPMVDLSTGSGLFQRSMWGLNGPGMPTQAEVGSYFTSNSQVSAGYSSTGVDRWARMGQSSVGQANQDRIIQAAMGGGIVGMQRLGQQWQYEISDRMEAASIGLSQAGARLSHEYATQYQQPESLMQIQMGQAADFGGTVQTDWMKQHDIPAYNAGRGRFAIQQDQYAIDLESMRAQNTQGLTRLGWQMQDVNRQQYQFDVQAGWQRQDMQVQRGRQLTQRGWQQEEFGYQENELAISRQAFREDTAYNKQVRQLQYGWQMEDADINIRRATGFERRQLVKQKSRETEMYNLESGQIDVQTKRQEDQFKREEAHLKKQEDHFKAQSKWEDDDWKKEQTRFEIRTKWEDDQFNIQRGRISQEMGWAKEAADRQEKQFALRKEQLDAEVSQAATLDAEKKVMYQAEVDNEQKRFELSMQAVVMTQAEKDKTRELQTQIEQMRQEEEDRVAKLNKIQLEFYQGMIEWMKTQPWWHGAVSSDPPKDPPPPPPPPGGTPFEAMGGPAIPGKIVGESGPELLTSGYVLPTRFLTPRTDRNSGGSFRVEAMVPVTLNGRNIAEAIVPFLLTPIRNHEQRNVGRR